MKSILFKLLGRSGDLINIQPVLALFVGSALVTVFLVSICRARLANDGTEKPGLIWLLYGHGRRLAWALMLVGLLLAALSLMRTYLRQTLGTFQRTHGRVTEANYRAVQTIWGTEQQQVELQAALFWEEEVTERIESEDLTKPAVLRKKILRHDIGSNPFLAARHLVTLRQNPRKKGSALYGGYETACQFQWRLKNPADRDVNSVLKFPLPAAGAMYNDLTATLNGKDILPQMELKDGALVLARDWKAGEPLDMGLSFTSRGMSSWYFQVREPREIRDFTLTLTLPDLAKGRLNNPEGCMAPTSVKPTADNLGSIVDYRLDHAISGKGMGVALPTPVQPGAATNSVLAETERGWLLLFAMLILGLTLSSIASSSSATNHSKLGRFSMTVPLAVLLSLLFGTAAGVSYGMLADFSDLLFGFWGTAGLVLLPLFAFLAWLLTQITPSRWAWLLGGQLILFGILYPVLAGLDAERQPLYFNICALCFLASAAYQLALSIGSNSIVEADNRQTCAV